MLRGISLEKSAKPLDNKEWEFDLRRLAILLPFKSLEFIPAATKRAPKFDSYDVEFLNRNAL